MALQVYNKKRNFKDTPEPSGKVAHSKSGLSFVIQRHKASHLHYDFRLEMDGVLKSWAVPKGPSLNPKDKRLAMMVEDHPYSYKDFSGKIPEGNYGAGIVEIWDHGVVTDLDRSDKKSSEKKLKAGLAAGNLKFRLQGKKLKGEFALVKLKSSTENAWLLIKHNDEHAVAEPYNSEEHTAKNSPINTWLAKQPKTSKKTPTKKVTEKPLKKESTTIKKKEAVKRQPSYHSSLKPGRKLENYIKPMLAKETDKPFSNKDWIYEMKWDGYRAVAEVNKKKLSLYSRNGNSFMDSYPVVVEALQKLNIQAVLDGEIVVMDEHGKSNFQALQHYDATGEPVMMEYRVFDLLSLHGKSTAELPLTDRKKLLKTLIDGKSEVIKYSDHVLEKGEAFFKAAKKNDLEGIIAKKADSQYAFGTRTTDWLKIKNHKSMDAIIVGFTAPGGSRSHFGALVLAVKQGSTFQYIGHTGSGFTAKSLADLSRTLKPLIQKKSPFLEVVKTNMPVTWVKPVLVCEIKYSEWTTDNHLRHPIFLRLREDKKVSEVTMSANKPLKKEALKKVVTKQRVALKKGPSKKIANKPSKAEASLASQLKSDVKESVLTFGKIKVKVTNRQKVFWPEEGVTKGDVIDYYQNISKYILPYLKDRPQSLKRNPNGINDSGFFHKDAGDEAPDWVKSTSVFSESTHKNIEYILCNNAATLAYLNNLGCIELNPWHSTLKDLDKPDYLVIDIDPSDKNTFNQVIEAANVVNDIFKKAGVTSYCKTSGATGLHVYVPTQKKYTYDQLKDFAHLICMLTQEQLPDFTSLERNLKKRGNKMIYMDHLQNRRGQTISSVYSLRPKEGATVSMPILWKEVKPGLSPQDFTIHNALKHIQKSGDRFSPVLGKGIDLAKCLKLLDQ